MLSKKYLVNIGQKTTLLELKLNSNKIMFTKYYFSRFNVYYSPYKYLILFL